MPRSRGSRSSSRSLPLGQRSRSRSYSSSSSSEDDRVERRRREKRFEGEKRRYEEERQRFYDDQHRRRREKDRRRDSRRRSRTPTRNSRSESTRDYDRRGSKRRDSRSVSRGRTPSDDEARGAGFRAVRSLRASGKEREDEAGTLEFKDKLFLVKYLLKEVFPELPWDQEGSHEVVEGISMDPVEREDKGSLPYAGNTIATLFDEFLGEVKGKKLGSDKLGVPLDFKSLPTRQRVKIDKFYKVTGLPWLGAAATRPDITNSSLYVSKSKGANKNVDFPDMKVKEKQLMAWETSCRNVLSVSNHGEWFLAASKLIMLNSMKALRTEKMTEEILSSVWNDLREGYQLLDSVGRCFLHSSTELVGVIGGQVLLRRDSWLDRFAPEVTRQAKMDLRLCDLNETVLFGEAELEKARKSLKEEKLDKVQTSVLRGQANIQNIRKNANTSAGGAGRGFKDFPLRKPDLRQNVGRGGSSSFRDQGARKDFPVRPPRGRGRGGFGGGRGGRQ